MNLETFIELHNAYVIGRQLRDALFQMKAAQYANEFEAAYIERLAIRKAETKQWQEIILPKIREEARLLAYEKAMASKNSAAVAEAR